MKRIAALTYGTLGYLFFIATFGYTVGFIGNIGVRKSIDNGSTMHLAIAIAVDLALLGLFAVQHSVMARQGFKRRWTQIVPPVAERPTYVIAATLALVLLLWQWRPIPHVVWDVTGTAAEPILRASFWIGWGVLLLSTFLVNHFELFGLAQVWNYFLGRTPQQPVFRTPSLYRVVRHPLYLGFVIAFWSAARMTAGHLLFSTACTGYILVGIYFEERDLLASYGQSYREYRRRVPMLIPFFKRGGPNAASSESARPKLVKKTQANL